MNEILMGGISEEPLDQKGGVTLEMGHTGKKK